MKPIKQAVILVGGLGTRLRPITLTTPKPMIRIYEKPFLQYLIELLRSNGITEVILLVGYLHEQIEAYFGDGRKFGISIAYSYNPPETDTGSRLREAVPLLQKTFLLLYGDNYWPLQLKRLAQFYYSMGTKAVVTAYHNRDGATKNNMLIEGGLVQAYDKSRKRGDLNGVDIGFFILNKSVLKNLPTQNFSFEEVIVPMLIEQKQLAGFLTEHKYYGLSTPERIPAIQEYFSPKKILFLDRDGVINTRPQSAEYVSRWADFIFLPKVKEALMMLTQKGYELYIVSNQAGIARGKVTREQVNSIHRRLVATLKKIGVTIADIVVCPHGWDQECFCRKPNPGLFFDLSYKHKINLFESICVGDDPRDIVAGILSGCKTIYVGPRAQVDFPAHGQPDRIYNDLYAVAQAL